MDDRKDTERSEAKLMYGKVFLWKSGTINQLIKFLNKNVILFITVEVTMVKQTKERFSAHWTAKAARFNTCKHHSV